MNEQQALTINGIALEIFGGNVAVGWWDDSEKICRDDLVAVQDKYLIPTKMMLMVSELAEAMEGFRKNLNDDHLPERSMIEVEFADAIIRILDCAGYLNLDVGGAMRDKLIYNSTREDHKRENRVKAGGKTV